MALGHQARSGEGAGGSLSVGPRNVDDAIAPLRVADRAERSFDPVEPEPDAGGAGRVFRACADRLPSLSYSVWRFRPPFDRLFRLSPSSPVRQVVYAYVRDESLTRALAEWAEPA